MKNILLVIDSLGSGGAQNQLTLLAVGLKNNGYEVTVLTYYNIDFFKSRLDECGIPVILEVKRGKLGVNVIKRIAKVVDEMAIDTVISYLHTPNLYAALAMKIIKNQVKLIVSYRSHTVFENMSWYTLQLRKFVNSTADIIIANSYHERDKWINKFPLLEKKIQTIYNGVDNSKFHHLGRSKVVKDILLVVGSVGPAKNGILIIEALNILKNKGVSVNVKWIGKKVFNIASRKEYFERMSALIRLYGLENTWDWCDPIHDIESEFKCHKAVILASTIEGLPNVVCESLACGTPVILSNVLDHPILVQEGFNGFLFDPTNAQDLAKAIEKLNSLSSEDYNLLIENSSTSANVLFSKSKMIDSYLNVIQDVK